MKGTRGRTRTGCCCGWVDWDLVWTIGAANVYEVRRGYVWAVHECECASTEPQNSRDSKAGERTLRHRQMYLPVDLVWNRGLESIWLSWNRNTNVQSWDQPHCCKQAQDWKWVPCLIRQMGSFLLSQWSILPRVWMYSKIFCLLSQIFMRVCLRHSDPNP